MRQIQALSVKDSAHDKTLQKQVQPPLEAKYNSPGWWRYYSNSEKTAPLK